MMGRWWIRLFLKSIYLLFLKERLKLLKIQRQPLMNEVKLTGNRIVDMELFAAVIHMLGCSFCKKTSIILQEDY